MGRLCFPNTITMLCKRAGMPIRKEDDVLFDKGIIDSSNLEKLMRGEGPPSQGGLMSWVHKILDQQEVVLHCLEDMEMQQQTYWLYAQQGGVVLRNAMQANFPHLYSPFPPFPDEVLMPWIPHLLGGLEEENEGVFEVDLNVQSGMLVNPLLFFYFLLFFCVLFYCCLLFYC